MKIKSTVLATALLLNAFSAYGAKASYYRFWRGFKKPTLTDSSFLGAIPNFMNQTLDLYKGKGLSNYIVGMPPTMKSTYIPDEIALVAFDSEDSYRTLRSTPEGKEYAEAHWDLFNKDNSKSANLEGFDGKQLNFEVATDVLGKPVDWSRGVTFFYIGERKKDVSLLQFQSVMTHHVQAVKDAFTPYGIKGYIILLSEHYEIAFMNFDSMGPASQAFASKEGVLIQEESASIMNTVVWNVAAPFEGTVTYGQSYSTVKSK